MVVFGFGFGCKQFEQNSEEILPQGDIRMTEFSRKAER